MQTELISIVVPVFNEEDNVVELHRQVAGSLQHTYDWELIFVDDCSTDNTRACIRRLHSEDSRVKLIALRRNSGQTPAMVAGIKHAQGETIVTMDGDLQNDPLDIPVLMEHMKQGYDIVVGWRRNRQDALVTRKIPSVIANRLIGRVTGVPIRDNGCSLKAYRADLIKGIELYSEMHRFIPAMASMTGSRIKEIPVRHHPRIHGESKYGLKRIYKVALDLVVVRTLLSTLGSPIKYFSRLVWLPTIGALLSLVGFFSAWLNGQTAGVFLTMALLWATTSFFILLLGVLGESLYRTSDRRETQLASMTLRVDS